MFHNIAPQTIILGVCLICSLLALCGKLPLITALLSGASAFILLVYVSHTAQNISIIIAVLVWFILWRIGVSVRNRHRKSRTPKGKLSVDDPAVRIVLNDMQETLDMMLAAGKGASLVSNGMYEGTIAILPVSRNDDNVYQIAMMMLDTPDLLDTTLEFIRRNPNAYVNDPGRFASLLVFAQIYQSYYVPADHRYLIITSEKLTLPRRATRDDLQALCIDEAIRRNDLAVRFSNCVIHTRNVAR